MAAKPDAKPAADAAPAKKGFPILLVLIVLIVGVGGGGAAAYFLLPKGGDAAAEAPAKEEKKAPAQYLALEPAFVVNLADEGSTRYLQTELQVMARDPKVIAELTTHMPAVRNALLMLFSKQKQADVRSQEGREKLQSDALVEINRVLEEETGSGSVEALFFTSLVTQ